MWEALPYVVAGGASLLGSLANVFSQADTNKYMKGMQKEAWRREDTAVQRRAKDMEAAGINPLLAAGSPASSSSPVQITAPQVDTEQIASIPSKMMMMQQMRKNFAQTDADISRTNEATRAQRMANDVEEWRQKWIKNDQYMRGNTIDDNAAAAGQVEAEIYENARQKSFVDLAAAKSVAEQAAYDAARAGTLSESAARDFNILKERGLRSNADPGLMSSMDYKDYMKGGHGFKKAMDLLGSGFLKTFGGNTTSYPNTAGLTIKAAEAAAK